MVHQYHRKLWVYWRIFSKFDELQRHHHYLEIVIIEFLVLLYPFLPALTRRCLLLCSSALQDAGWDQQFGSWKLEVLKTGVRKTRPGFLVLGVHLQPLGLVEHLGLLQPLVVGNYGIFRDLRGARESKKWHASSQLQRAKRKLSLN